MAGMEIFSNSFFEYFSKQFSFATTNLLYLAVLFSPLPTLSFLVLGAFSVQRTRRIPLTMQRVKSFYTDVQYFYFYTLALSPLLIYSIAHLLPLKESNDALRAWLRGLPLWLQVLAVLYVVDLALYWQHRLMHTKYLWPFHAVHHSTEHIHWLSNMRSSLIDDTVVIAMFIIPYSCGFSMEVVALATTIRGYYGYFVHMDIPVSFGPLRYVLVSPLQHRWHHAKTRGDTISA